MPTISTPSLDAFRAQRESLRRTLSEKTSLRTKEHEAVAAAVVKTGEAPADWSTRSRDLDSEIQSIQLGLGRIEGDINEARMALTLRAVRLEQKKIPLERRLGDLYFRRSELFESTVLLVGHKHFPKRDSLPADLGEKILELEQQIDATTTELSDLMAEIATVRAPLVRDENDQRAA